MTCEAEWIARAFPHPLDTRFAVVVDPSVALTILDDLLAEDASVLAESVEESPQGCCPCSE